MSHMATTIRTQPDELRRLLGDPDPARAAARQVAGRRTWLVGIGTSWHAAHHGAWLLHEAGIDAFALHAADVAPYARRFDAADAVIVLSHTGHTGYTAQALEAAREAGAAVVHVTGIGAGGDVETVVPETSYAYTASHTGALMRLAQIAEALGAGLGDLAAVPDVVARTLDAPAPIVDPPARLLELIGAGPNAWTAQEGALKIREASYVATEGLSSEQFLHGPSVALDRQDTLVVLDGGGPGAARTAAIAARDGGDGGARRAHRRARSRRGALDLPVDRLGAAHRARAGPGPRRQSRPLPLRGGPPPRAGHRGARLLIVAAALRSLPRLPIETPRLRLRPLHPADLAALHAIQSREDVCRWLDRGPRSRDEVREALEGHIARLRDRPAEGVVLAVVPVTTGELVGYVSLAVGPPEHRQGEIGFLLHPDLQGRGYATQAAEAMLALAFETYGVHRVVGRLEARNVASVRVLEKLGMRREAHLIENERVKDECQSELVYAVLAREWRASR